MVGWDIGFPMKILVIKEGTGNIGIRNPNPASDLSISPVAPFNVSASVSASGTQVTGAFSTIPITIGDQITIGSGSSAQTRTISAIAATTLTVTQAWTGSIQAQSYIISPACRLSMNGNIQVTAPGTWQSGAEVTLSLGDTNQTIQTAVGLGMSFKTFGPGGSNSFIWKNTNTSSSPELMRLWADYGNLGLGTSANSTSSGPKLQVNGSAAIGYSNATTAPALGLAVSGSMGIGTTTPNSSSKLDVKGNVTVQGPNWSTGNEAKVFLGDVNNYIKATYSQGVRIGVYNGTAGEDAIFLQQVTKNLGVGASNPANKLAVSGNASIGADYATTAAPTDGLIVKGQVLIGKTIPIAGYALDVNGTINATAINIGGQAIPGILTGHISVKSTDISDNNTGVITWSKIGKMLFVNIPKMIGTAVTSNNVFSLVPDSSVPGNPPDFTAILPTTYSTDTDSSPDGTNGIVIPCAVYTKQFISM